MPIYLFVDGGGKEYEIYYPAEEAPSIGDEVRHQDRNLRRVASFYLDEAGIRRKTHKYPYVSSILPRNTDGAQSTKHGKPIITSQKHEREVAARHDYFKS